MATAVELRNERTGEIKRVKVGWSWVLFLFSGVLGIPLFVRRLYAWGAIMLTIWFVNLIGPELLPDDDTALGLQIVLFVVTIGLAIFLGIKGNELTAKNYLEHGWEWAAPEDSDTAYAKAQWALA